MSESEFVLAIDAGTHRLTAVTACAAPSRRIEVASFAVGGGRDSTAVLAVVTADGDLLFGDEAVQTAALHPERAVREVVSRIGDDVPLIAGGYAVLPEQVLARLVLWVAAAAAAHHGARPAAIALAHPADWQAYRVELVTRALRDVDLEVTLVPSPVAAAHGQLDADAAPARGLRAVFDLGGSTCTATIVRTGSAGVRQIAPAVVIEGTGGGAYDDALLAHALAMTGIDGIAAASTPDGRDMLIAARASAVAAKESLSFDGDAEMLVPLAERPARVRITRSEFENMIGDDLDTAVEALDAALDAAELSAQDLTEVVLVGGSSRIPLAVQRLSGRFDVSLAATPDPASAIACGAARQTWAAWEARRPVPPPAPDAEQSVEDERQPRAGLFGALRGRATKIATPAASAAALTVTAVLVGGGIILGTTAPAGDRSDAADAENLMEAGVGGDLFAGARHHGDFSVVGGTVDEPVSDALTDGLGDALGLDTSDVAVSEPRSRTPQAPGDPSSPPKASPKPATSTDSGSSSAGTGGSPSSSGGTGGTDYAPTDPAPTDPAPSEPGPTDPSPSDPAPSDPAPSDPSPSDPAPSEPAPSDPAPSDPSPADPGPADPAPTDPSSPPVDPQPPEPDPSPPAAQDPTSPSADPSSPSAP